MVQLENSNEIKTRKKNQKNLISNPVYNMLFRISRESRKQPIVETAAIFTADHPVTLLAKGAVITSIICSRNSIQFADIPQINLSIINHVSWLRNRYLVIATDTQVHIYDPMLRLFIFKIDASNPIVVTTLGGFRIVSENDKDGLCITEMDLDVRCVHC